MATPLEFDGERDVAFAHHDDRFLRVMHVFHTDWHGIRSAAACLPGRKLAIPHEGDLDGEFFRHVIGLVVAHRIEVICLQGLSRNAIALASVLRSDLGRSVRIVAVTHVTSAQFEHFFEIEMQHMLLEALRSGLLDRAGSVKPRFDCVVAGTWPHTIYNCAPNIAGFRSGAHDRDAVFIPVENTWRKNLFTQILGAAAAPEVRTIYVVNHPSGLERIADLQKLRRCGYMRGMNLYAFMGSVACMLNVTLAECQPMTQLEALAMGTPCLTGPLGLAEFARHPVTELTEVPLLDTPAAVTAALRRLLSERRRDEAGFLQMLDDYMNRRNAASLDSYLAFFEG